MADTMVLDLADPEELSLFARGIPFPTGVLNRWLPAVTRRDHRYRFFRRDNSLRAALPVRPWDTPAVPIDRGQLEEVTGRMLPISGIAWLLEEEAQILDAIRNAGGDSDEILNVFENDLDELVKRALQRIMLMQGQAIWQGKVTIGTQAAPENSLQLGDVDFQIPAAHNITAPILWNASTPGILGQLGTDMQTYSTTNGGAVKPSVMLTSTRVLNVMLVDPEVRAILGSLLGTPLSVGVNQLNALLADRQLPTLLIDDTAIPDHNGVMQRQIPDDRVILLPDPSIPVGATQWGVTEEAKRLVRSEAISEGNAPGLIAVPMESENPVRTGTLLTGIAMPVVTQPDYIFSLKVL